MSLLYWWGVEVFYPKIVQPGRKGSSLVPLFPTYMFCHLDPETRVWPAVRWAPGMLYFLGCDGVPSPIPEEMVDYLQRRVGHWNAQASVNSLDRGEKVAVLGGPFSGLEGIFQRYVPSKQRCQILLDVVGRMTRVELPEWDVAPALAPSMTLATPAALE